MSAPHQKTIEGPQTGYETGHGPRRPTTAHHVTQKTVNGFSLEACGVEGFSGGPLTQDGQVMGVGLDGVGRQASLDVEVQEELVDACHLITAYCIVD
jgi:hypothetical protein